MSRSLTYAETVDSLYKKYLKQGYIPEAAKRLAYAQANLLQTKKETRLWQKKRQTVATKEQKQVRIKKS